MYGQTLLSALPAAVVECATQLGWDRDALVAEAGLDAALLADPDARVPVLHDLRLWEVLSRRPQGLEIGALLGMAGLGVLGFAMRHGGTVGEALAWLARYRALLHPDLVPRAERRDGPEGARIVFARAAYPEFARLREPVYAQAAAVVASMRTLAGRPGLRARHVAYPLPRPADAERHERWFGAPVAWGSRECEVAFDASVLELPVPMSDPQLFSYLARRVEALHATLPPDAGVAERARREVGALLAAGEPRLGAVARRLALSERTLHRRLAEAGTTFARLVEAERRERAELLLGDARLSCSEVAFLLGYSEPATFFRAFRRWTGETPQRWRRLTRA